MDNEVVQVTVGLCIGLPLGYSYNYVCSSCRSEPDELGTHELSCQFSTGRHLNMLLLMTLLDRYWILLYMVSSH